jgi:hypothetical protein
MQTTISNYLNSPTSVLLSALPFKNWLVEKSYESDLSPPIIQYVFPENGLALRCSTDDIVIAIFLDSEELGGFDDGYSELSFSLTRQQVLNILGVPSKSGLRFKDPVLGEYGPWDRFLRENHTIHVEYAISEDKIKKITFMRSDLTP